MSGTLAGFVASLGERLWFGRCGEPLTATETEAARGWIAGLGLDVPPVAGVASWPAAAGLIMGPDWSRQWWNAETAQADRLRLAAYAALGEKACLEALTEVTEAAAMIRDRAVAALARAGIADEALAKVAAGAAAQACHQEALAILNQAGDGHAFARKFALFAAGRWPLGIVGASCFVF